MDYTVTYEMNNYLPAGNVIRLANRMLFYINNKLVRHNERTTFLALTLAKYHPMGEKCSIKSLLLLSLFHTLGFFRPNPILNYDPYDAEDIDFFNTTKDTESFYMYSSYYLCHMTPLKKDAYALETFTADYNEIDKQFIYQTEYKSIIYLCARISDFWAKNPNTPLPENLDDLAPGKIDPEYAAVFKKLNKDNYLLKQFETDEYHDKLRKVLVSVRYTKEETLELIKLLIYFLDFKSTYTMTHTINTACYALSLGRRLELSQEQLDNLFTSAFLHDIGKMNIPASILESPGKLSLEQYRIMKNHVNHSKNILNQLIPEEIMQPVIRHHERLDGSGYPEQRQEDSLSTNDRILMIADVTSALCDQRSYKESFPKDKVLEILTESADKGELDKIITGIMKQDFDEIQQEKTEYQKLFNTNYGQVQEQFALYFFNDSENIINNLTTEDDSLEELVIDDGLEELD